MDISLISDEDLPSQGIVLKKARAKASAGGTLSNNVTPSQGAALPQSVDYYGRSNAAQQRAEELSAQPIDYSAMQAFAKQRGEQGDAAMLNALAAQFAGEQFQPVQEQLLKKAAAAREPIKMAGGLITPEGGFLKDPEAERDKMIKMYSDQAARYAQIAQTADTARERIAAQKAQQDLMAQMRMMGLQIQQQGLQLRAENAALARQQQADAALQRKEKGLDEGTAKLSKQTDNITNLVAGVRDLNGRLGQYVTEGKTIPGVGYGSNIGALGVDLSGAFMGEEGKANRSMVQNVANELIRAAAGQAVSLNEAERQVLANMSSGKYSERDFLNAWENVILPKVNEMTANIAGGYSPEVKQRYRDNGGRIDFNTPFVAPTRAKPQAGPASNLSAQEQAELEALRKRFGR